MFLVVRGSARSQVMRSVIFEGLVCYASSKTPVIATHQDRCISKGAEQKHTKCGQGYRFTSVLGPGTNGLDFVLGYLQ